MTPKTTPKRPRGRPKTVGSDSSAGTLQSLDRALGMLTELARVERASLSDLARQADIPTATAHRILTTLQLHGFVSFSESRQEWAVGIEAYRTGASFLRGSNVLEVGQTAMRNLVRDSGETANLAVPDGGHVVFVGQVETPNPIRAFFPPGTRTEMYLSGTGKAILAAMEDDAITSILQSTRFQPFTPNTLADSRALRDDLHKTRLRGWSYDNEERHLGMSCIGAAVFDANGDPHAGVSVSGPSSRFQGDRIEELGKLVSNAARDITELSGGRWP